MTADKIPRVPDDVEEAVDTLMSFISTADCMQFSEIKQAKETLINHIRAAQQPAQGDNAKALIALKRLSTNDYNYGTRGRPRQKAHKERAADVATITEAIATEGK